jgi:DNA (cytosine-5)-methyltransferase 1
MGAAFQVVDLFAGPGGLAEGFSSYRDRHGHNPFDVTLSVEREASAHRTLQLRAFLRQFEEFPDEYYDALNAGAPLPDWSRTHSGEWETALGEALQLELGSDHAKQVLDARIGELLRREVPTVVIGGPPCQAYSLAGRARNLGKEDYVPAEDQRHFLYREYIRILTALKPVAFVMENVKGMLSSSVDGRGIFEQVLEDLRTAGGEQDSYALYAVGRNDRGRATLVPDPAHRDFVVRAETLGVPQARHRVIIVGVRRDLSGNARSRDSSAEGTGASPVSVRTVLEGLPRLRSGLSRDDSAETWRAGVLHQMDAVVRALASTDDLPETLLKTAQTTMERFRSLNRTPPRESREPPEPISPEHAGLAAWLEDDRLEVTLNHSARGHMMEDLGRYFFSAVVTDVLGRAPKAAEFPAALAPHHASWTTGKFVDRFRTQGWERFSTTVTSHISKDGHYFIHPDPLQCRSLSVREAARLQTFPDNYLFLGNRTQQYVQVGNAVPPYLARQIADLLWDVLGGQEPKQRL